MPDRFTEARLDRLTELDNSATTPADALALAALHLDRHGCSGNLIVIIEPENGGTTLVTSQATRGTAIYLLDAAKFSLHNGDYDG